MSYIHPSLWEKTSQRTHFKDLHETLEVDVAIVGGGITGITLADVLQRSGLRVCILERNELMSGTSGQTSAHLTTNWDLGYTHVLRYHGMKGTQALADAMRKAIAHISQRTRKVWDQVEFQTVPGYLYRDLSTEESDSGHSIAEEMDLCRKLGFSVEPMPKNLLPFPIKEGFSIDGQAKFHPIKYLEYVMEGFDPEQIKIFEHSPVLDFSEDEIRTPHGKVRTKVMVQATHTPIGFDLVQTAILPYRSYVIAGPTQAHIPEGLFWDSKNPYHYIRKATLDGKELLIIGGGDQRTGNEKEGLGFKKIENYAREKFQVSEIDSRWSSQVYIPADGLPYVGRDIGHQHSYIATGFSGDGLTLGTASALLLSELITKGYHPWEEVFSPRRNFSFNKDFMKHNAEVTKHLVKDRFVMDDLPPEKLQPGEGCVHAALQTPTAYYRDMNGNLNEMSAVCTHMKCVVHWNPEQKSFDCPCHGSRFSPDGEVIEGPALSPLARKK